VPIDQAVIDSIRQSNLLHEVVSRTTALKKQGRDYLGLCPLHDEKTPSFTISPQKGFFHCFGCGAHGDVIDFVRKTKGVSFKQAVAELTGKAQFDTQEIVKNKNIRPTPKKKKFEETLAKQIWESTQPLEGTLGEIYLKERNCWLPPDNSHLRFIPELTYPLSPHKGEKFPALIGLVTHAITQEPLTIRQIFLSKDGKGKAPVKVQKINFKDLPASEGVIRLVADEDVFDTLTIAEGVETALTAFMAAPPVWATGDSSNLSKLPVIGRVNDLLIIADNDEAGKRASETCATRWTDANKKVKIYTPEQKGEDLNDEVAA
jgi:phage/plasmid primase-like uncharacterized protein